MKKNFQRNRTGFRTANLISGFRTEIQFSINIPVYWQYLAFTWTIKRNRWSTSAWLFHIVTPKYRKWSPHSRHKTSSVLRFLSWGLYNMQKAAYTTKLPHTKLKTLNNSKWTDLKFKMESQFQTACHNGYNNWHILTYGLYNWIKIFKNENKHE